MRAPLRAKAAPQAQTSIVASFAAPVGGWNDRDALAEMAPTDAIALENFFPRPTYCEIRGGSSSHATGMTGNGKTLATYNALNGTNKMFCLTASGIYDVSSAGAVGSSKLARTDGKHQWVLFGDGTSNYLILCNGVDKPAYFDGTTWTAVDSGTSPALTGVTTTKLVYPMAFKGRLFFIEKDTLNFWYLAAGAAGGALTKFPLDGEAKKGGYLVAMQTWTIDAGDGPDDRLALITSEGEILVYEGTNPSSSTAWAKVGTYAVGKPIGRRCMEKLGGDLVVLTQNGAFPLSAALQSSAIDYKLALSNKIEKAFTAAALASSSIFGWRVTVFPAQSALLVNVPTQEDGVHEQYVMNTITKAWCKFKSWNAEDFVIYNGELYFTSGTAVYKAWTGTSDVGSNIIAYGKTAFNYFGRANTQKQFKMFRPVLATTGPLTFLTDIDVDFQDGAIVGEATYNTTIGAQWDVSNWDVGFWANSTEIVKSWTSPSEYPGACAAGKLKVSTNALTVQWMSCDYVFSLGGVL